MGDLKWIQEKITAEELIEAVLAERKVEPRTSKMERGKDEKFYVVLTQAVSAKWKLEFCRGAMSKDAIGGPKRKAIGLLRKSIDKLEAIKYDDKVSDDTIKEIIKNIEGLIEYEKTITKENRPGNKGMKLTEYLKKAIKHLNIILKTKPRKSPS